MFLQINIQYILLYVLVHMYTYILTNVCISFVCMYVLINVGIPGTENLEKGNNVGGRTMHIGTKEK